MTITPEKLRELLSVVTDGKRWFDTGWKQVGDALLEAADEIERLQSDVTELMSACNEALNEPKPIIGKVMIDPYDDCECVICETKRNPPPPSRGLVELVRKHTRNGGDVAFDRSQMPGGGKRP